MLREEIEKIAREAAESFNREYDRAGVEGLTFPDLSKRIQSALVTALRSEVIGYREALKWIGNDGDTGWATSVCRCYGGDGDDTDQHGPCTCICHTADAKLKEVDEL